MNKYIKRISRPFSDSDTGHSDPEHVYEAVPQEIKKILRAPLFCVALATMDQGIFKPPTHLKQDLFQAPVISTSAPLPPAFTPVRKAGIPLKVHQVECWLFDRVLPITASTGGTLTTDQITDWLKKPSRTIKGDTRPAVGLRLLCLEQEDSMKWPFDKVTFEAIQHALGLTKTSSYFNLPKSGACGKYLGISGQPSKTHSCPQLTIG